MFKRFTVEEHVSSTSQVKNSVQRSILSKLVEQYPTLEDKIEELLPKKEILVAKAQDNIQLIIIKDQILFYNQRDGPFYPTLKLLHQYPSMMPRMQVDKGATKFVLAGANIMCPGFTSPGGDLPIELETEQPVAIYAEGKVHALAIGLTKMTTQDIKTINKGIAVETVHFLQDGLWQTKYI